MALDLLWAFETQTLGGLSLETPVCKVNSRRRPTRRNISSSNVSLPRDDRVSDVFAGLAHIGTASQYELVDHHPDGEVVSGDCVIHSTNDLGGHIPWGAGGLRSILGLPESRYAKISNPEVALVVQHKVFGLNIPVYNPVEVYILQS